MPCRSKDYGALAPSALLRGAAQRIHAAKAKEALDADHRDDRSDQARERRRRIRRAHDQRISDLVVASPIADDATVCCDDVAAPVGALAPGQRYEERIALRGERDGRGEAAAGLTPGMPNDPPDRHDARGRERHGERIEDAGQSLDDAPHLVTSVFWYDSII